MSDSISLFWLHHKFNFLWKLYSIIPFLTMQKCSLKNNFFSSQPAYSMPATLKCYDLRRQWNHLQINEVDNKKRVFRHRFAALLRVWGKKTTTQCQPTVINSYIKVTSIKAREPTQSRSSKRMKYSLPFSSTGPCSLHKKEILHMEELPAAIGKPCLKWLQGEVASLIFQFSSRIEFPAHFIILRCCKSNKTNEKRNFSLIIVHCCVPQKTDIWYRSFFHLWKISPWLVNLVGVIIKTFQDPEIGKISAKNNNKNSSNISKP